MQSRPTSSDRTETRPPLGSVQTGAELHRWYWLKDELVAFARSLGVRTSGGKQVLSARIASALDGVDFVEPTRASTAGAQLSGPLDAATLVPQGQRCSQAVRAWFSDELGHSFRFDARMRDWFAATDGTYTLADALSHHLAREADEPRREIGEQFEYNRFARAWYAANPEDEVTSVRADRMRAAWQAHRSLPRGTS